MCNSRATWYTNCSCIYFRLIEKYLCAARPDSVVKALDTTFNLNEYLPELDIRRRFDEVLERPYRQIVATVRVFAPVDNSFGVTKDATSQACVHTKLQIRHIHEEPGMCNRCHVGLKPGRRSGRRAMLPRMLVAGDTWHQADDRSMFAELVQEFGHFDEIGPPRVMQILHDQNGVRSQRREDAQKRTCIKQRTALQKRFQQARKLAALQEHGAQARQTSLRGIEQQPADPVPDVDWEFWLTNEIIQGWKEEEKAAAVDRKTHSEQLATASQREESKTQLGADSDVSQEISIHLTSGTTVSKKRKSSADGRVGDGDQRPAKQARFAQSPEREHW